MNARGRPLRPLCGHLLRFTGQEKVGYASVRVDRLAQRRPRFGAVDQDHVQAVDADPQVAAAGEGQLGLTPAAFRKPGA